MRCEWLSESLSFDIVFEREGLRALCVGLADGLNGEDGGETVLSYRVGVDIEADFVWFAIVRKGKRKAMRRRWWTDAKVARPDEKVVEVNKAPDNRQLKLDPETLTHSNFRVTRSHGVLLFSPFFEDPICPTCPNMDTTPDAPATTDFRNCALPALAAASPALAARYAIRARRTCPNIKLSPLHCPRCGHLALSTRLQRQRKSTSSRVHRTNKGKDKRPHPQQHPPPHSHYTSIRRTCAACGFTDAEAVAVAGDPVRASLKANFPKTASTRANARSAKAFPSGQELDAVQRPSDKVAEAPSVKVSFAPEMKATVQSTPNTSQASAGSAPRAGASIGSQRDTKPVSSASLSSKRAKKKSGLQEMLARSREQKSKKEDGAPGSGLAAFLSGL